MNENNSIETKLRNLTFIVIFGFIVMFLLIVGLYFRNGNSTDTNTNAGGSDTTVEYDVSKMKQVSGKTAAKLFEEKGTYILYIGRSTCGVCVNLVPELNKVIAELDININYLPLESTFRTDFVDLFKHLTIETEINGNKGTYGELLESNGYTPMVIVIKDGKMVDGFVGYRTSDTISSLFSKYM